MEDGRAMAFSHSRLNFSRALTQLSVATTHPINLASPQCCPITSGSELSEVASPRDPETPTKRRAGRSCRDLLQPPGMLFEINREYECYALSGSEQGNVLEETTIHGNHKVSTCFDQGNVRNGKSIWLSTSHNFDTKSSLTSYYSNDFKGGDQFIMNLLHNLSQASLLATGFRKGSQNDPVFEVELQQDNGTLQATECLEANLRTGQKNFRLRTKNILGRDAIMTSSYTTDFRDDTSLKLEVATTISSSFVITYSGMTNLSTRRELCLKGAWSIKKHTVLETSLSTDFSGRHCTSMAAKHVVNRCREVSLKLTSDYLGIPELSMSTSFLNDRDQWGWKYRNEARNHHILGLEWKRGFSSDHYYTLRFSSRNTGCNLYAELQLPLQS